MDFLAFVLLWEGPVSGIGFPGRFFCTYSRCVFLAGLIFRCGFSGAAGLLQGVIMFRWVLFQRLTFLVGGKGKCSAIAAQVGFPLLGLGLRYLGALFPLVLGPFGRFPFFSGRFWFSVGLWGLRVKFFALVFVF